MNLHLDNNSHFKRILVFGTSGQLARSLISQLPPEITRSVSRAEADFKNSDACLKVLKEYAPSLVINATAYTKVDLAEKEQDEAFQVNATTPGEISRWCATQDVPFIHYSTDYVFSGQGDKPWKESDPIQPLNTYGQSKAEGERLIQSQGGRFLIFRTSWVYAEQGQNFVRTMLRLGAEKDSLKIVSDQVGAPTYASDLASGSLNCFLKATVFPTFPKGIYHLCNQGETSWFHFAEEIFRLARSRGVQLKVREIHPITSSEYPTPARRPLNSRLNTTHVESLFNVKLPHWKESLKTCLEEMV